LIELLDLRQNCALTAPEYKNGQHELLKAMKEMTGCQTSKGGCRSKRSDGQDRCHKKMIASQEQTVAKKDAWLEEMRDDRKETMSCRLMMEACLDSKE
jgi:hypothetical protein